MPKTKALLSRELPPKPWWWMHDKPAGMWYLVSGEKGKETSVIPALEAWDDFDQRPEAKFLLRALNQHEVLMEIVKILPRFLETVEAEYKTLTDGQFGKFSDKPVTQALLRKLADLCDVAEEKPTKA